MNIYFQTLAETVISEDKWNSVKSIFYNSETFEFS